MGEISKERFEELVSEMTDRLLGEVKRFAEEKQLGSFSTDALHQMSTPLTEITGELLMFGSDVWPFSTI
jgi:hypothetical protein